LCMASGDHICVIRYRSQSGNKRYIDSPRNRKQL